MFLLLFVCFSRLKKAPWFPNSKDSIDHSLKPDDEMLEISKSNWQGREVAGIEAIAKEVTSGTESNLLFQRRRKSNYASKCLQAKEDISLVSSPNLHHGVRKEPLEGF
ncbi:spermatogenesis-associated protein 45 isoform X1 [Mustela lutreola]|uniref:spermatogenesis-associated protein 45 isoform X1 n=1 Tax=Mustela lutreola TaxID=9666 RepID=UPI002797C421|nr:spermatogenesis-associated protein 45 isoform X1 [Mustela lutreola]